MTEIAKDHTGFVSYESSVESARFGRRVFRYVLTSKDPQPMLDQIRLDAVDLAIVRIPTSQADLIFQLNKICEEVVFGDCLIIYSRDNLKAGPSRPLRNKIILRTVTPSDFHLLDSMNETIFEGYRNHYSNNPRLGDFNVVEGYKEWTRLHATTPGKQCLLAYIDNSLCGYCAIEIDEKDSSWVLGGVMPEFRGMGVYRDLLRATVDIFMRAGAPVTTFSTQVEHTAVQRVWVTEGFSLTRSYYTIHLNSVKGRDSYYET